MKKTAILLALALCLSICAVPAAAASAMADIVLSVKGRVEIPAEHTEFRGSSNVSDGKTYWSLTWSTPEDSASYGHTSVETTDDGIIISYSNYVNDKTAYKSGKTLPLLTEEQALEKLHGYIAAVNPQLAAEYTEVTQTDLSGKTYYFYVRRVVGGIPVFNNQATVALSSQTGALESYYLTHTATATFGTADGAMDMDAAKAAYAASGDFELCYVTYNDDDAAHLVYRAESGGYMLDAFTGEQAQLLPDASRFMYDTAKSMAVENSAAGMAPQLTEKELTEIEAVEGLLSYEDGVARVLAMEGLNVMPDMHLSHGSLYKDNNEHYYMHIELQTENDEKNGKPSYYANATLDAQTGVLQSFDGYFGSDDAAVTHTEAEAESLCTAFVAAQASPYAAMLGTPTAKQSERYVNYLAERQNGGIPFAQNYVRINVDLATLKIRSYALNWNEKLTFDDAAGVLSADDATSKLWEVCTPQLLYVANENAPAQLVYRVAYDDFAYLDAKTGVRRLYDGRDYGNAPQYTPYTDIDGHYAAEAIRALASIGAWFGGGLFHPDTVITQKEYVTLLAECVMDYRPLRNGVLDTAQIYSAIVGRGVLDAEEVVPDTPLTREWAVTYLLRMMEYKNFAEIKGIFRTDFADEAAIDEALIGYVAIARGLGIISGDGGTFAPKREMTRAEAATVMYNYLKK